MRKLRTVMTGIVFGEQPRWHDDRLWFSDWGTREVIAVDLAGNSEVILQAPSFPCCVDWLPDGRLLVVSGSEGLLLRSEPDGSLVTQAHLKKVASPAPGNELVVDGRGNAYINGGGFDLGRRAIRSGSHRHRYERRLNAPSRRWSRLSEWNDRNAG